jgi:hypothetical protein
MMASDMGSVRHDVALLLVVMLGTALLTTLPAVSKADILLCGQAFDLAAARLRWAAARQIRIDPVDNDKNCRAYSISFYEAATVRQTISICRDGLDHQRDLYLIDSEIDTFNNLIAAQCGY